MESYTLPTDHLLPPEQVPKGKIPGVIVTCGSYNPIHASHIESFDAARAAIESGSHADEVQIVGAFLSPVNDGYKKAGLAPFSHRLALCELALKEHKWLNVDPWEGMQSEFVRSYYVLHHVAEDAKKVYGGDVRVYFLCGADLFETFYRPGCWELSLLKKIFEDFHMCVIKRVGSQDPKEVIAKGGEPLTNEEKEPGVSVNLSLYLEKITVAEISPNETSSTKIRNAIKENDKKLLEELVPAACVPYLLENDVYPRN